MLFRTCCYVQRLRSLMAAAVSCLLCICSSSVILAQTPDGLIAHYSFDGLSGPVVDSLGAFDGINHGAVRGVAGVRGNAFQFDGFNQYVDTIPSSAIPANCTISLWIFPTDTTSQDAGQIFGTVSQIQAGPHGLVAIYYEIDTTESDGVTPHSYREGVSSVFYHERGRMLSPRDSFPLNTWTHLTMTFDAASNFRIYANGVLTTSEIVQQFAAPLVHDRALMFGQGILSQSVGFDGRMDEVRIYDRVLSVSEVNDAYLCEINQDPVADARATILEECEDGVTFVALDGTLSADPDGDDLFYEWSVPDGSGAVIDDPGSATPVGLFPFGPTRVTLTVTDGKCGMDVTDVTVIVEDTTPPVWVCETSKTSLWPPNHRMEVVGICISVSDNCSNPEDLLIDCRVSSSEPDDGNGDGSHTGDVDGFDGFNAPVSVDLTYDAEEDCFVGSVALRAERDGGKAGRTYSIVCDMVDEQGNPASASCVVVVPHNNRK